MTWKIPRKEESTKQQLLAILAQNDENEEMMNEETGMEAREEIEDDFPISAEAMHARNYIM